MSPPAPAMKPAEEGADMRLSYGSGAAGVPMEGKREGFRVYAPSGAWIVSGRSGMGTMGTAGTTGRGGGSRGRKGIGGLLGMGGAKGEAAVLGMGQPQMPGYEPSVSSDSDSPPASDNPPLPPTPLEVPLSALPQASSSKRMPFSKSSTAPNALPRPKNNLRSSNSTFVTRLQALDTLPKILA